MTNPASDTTDRFEDRLLHELRAALPRRAMPQHQRLPARRRRGRILIGGLATATAAMLAGALAVTAGSPAYAIHPRPDGSFVVVLNGVTTDQLGAAERELRGKGARIELVTSTVDCLGVFNRPDPALPAEPHGPRHGSPRPGEMPEFDAFSPMPRDRRNPATGKRLGSQQWAFTVRPDAIPSDRVLWVALAGEGAMLVAVVEFAPVGAGRPDFCVTR